MSKFKLTQTAAEVQDILNNSLQKPTGLAKTELVGVGVNGQENIEIGDNLTLANGKLSAAAGGGGGSGTPRHGYSIFIYDIFHYEVYTTKDYGWQIGKYSSITDFKSNNNYRELRYEGDYPASGIRYTSDGSEKQVIVRFEIINRDNCYITGYDVAKASYFRQKMPENALNTVNVIKLY